MNVTIDPEGEARMKARGDRELKRKKTFFHREIVEEKVKPLFPDHDPDEILQLLDAYHSRFAELVWRVQLAILKLSEGDLEQLRHHVNAAKSDYRDVLLPAENPEFLRVGIGPWLAMSDDEKDALSNRDVQQYIEWARPAVRPFFGRLRSLLR